MFRVVTIQDILDGDFNEQSFIVEDAFFFTIKIPNYYIIYNTDDEIIGLVPEDYNLFFKIDHQSGFEDIDIHNLIRLYSMGDEFKLVGTKADSHKAILIDSKTISRFELIEDTPINIPFTNKAFDSDGIIVFKNMLSLSDSLDIDDMY